MSAAWWVFLVVGIPVIFYRGAAIKGILTDPFPFSPWYNMLPALTTALYGFQMNGPAWPDAQPWDITLFLIVAVIVVVLDHRRMLSRAGTVTAVLMPGDEVVSSTITVTAER